MITIKKTHKVIFNTRAYKLRSFKVVFTEKKEPGDVIETTRKFLWQKQILDLSPQTITNNWSVDNLKDTSLQWVVH